MNRIVGLFIVIVVLVAGGTAFAGGKIGRVTQVLEVLEDTYYVYFSEDTNAPGPSSGDSIYQLNVSDDDFKSKGLLELFKFAVQNKEKYNCYINNGGYQSSGGQQWVAYAQLVERQEKIKQLEDKINYLEKQIKYLRSWILELSSKI